MFGLSFLNGVFLVGLVAAAVPIVIHLLNRRRIRRIKFSSLEFLDEQSQRRMRKINLRRIIILILRTLAVLLLVMAFARPTMRGAFFIPGKAPKNVVICLDASYSMGLDRKQGTAFSQGKDIARRLVDEAGRDDLINLIVFSDRAEPTLEKGSRNKALIRGAIDRAALTAEVTSLGKAIDRAWSLVDDSDIEGGEIYVVSDFRFNLDSTLVDPDRARDDVRMYFLPVYDESVDNVSIDRVLVPRKLLRPGEVIRVSVAVTNHSRTATAEFSLDLGVEGNRKAEKVLSLAPGASQTVTFPISFTEWGEYRCVVSKNRDRLPADDDRYFVLEVSRSVPVLIVRGKRRHGGGDGAAAGYFYLERALNPRATGEGEFTVKTVDERDLTASDLPTRGVVIWVDPQKLESRRLGLLERYVRRGGGVMVFLGGSDRRLWQERRVRQWLGFKSATDRANEVQVGYTSFQQDHPIFSIFKEEELELLTRTRVRGYVRAAGVAPDSVLAYIGGGDPAVWECARGRGRVLVFAAAPDLESGDIPLSPMFLPLVHTSVSYLATSGGVQRHRENLAGAPLLFDVVSGGATPVTDLLIRDPANGPVRPVLFDTPNGETRVICERPARVGFYRLVADTTTLAELAVNLDTRESDIASSSLPEDQRYASVVSTGEDFSRSLQEARQGREVFALFVFLAAMALAAEAILGRRA